MIYKTGLTPETEVSSAYLSQLPIILHYPFTTNALNMTATTFNKWVLAQPNGFESLKLSSSSMPSNLGDYDVLVRMMAVSLNYRDILILNVGVG